MPDRAHHRLFSVWHSLRKYLAIGLLVFGVVVGLITVLLPFTELYQGPLESFLSRQWNRSVKLGELSGRWRGTGPEFEIHNLTIAGDTSVAIDRAKLKLNIYKYLWPGGSNGLELVVNSAALELAGEQADGDDTVTDKKRTVSPRIIEQLMASGSLLIENLAFRLSPQWQKKFKTLLQQPLQTALQVQQDKNLRAVQLTVSGEGLVKQAKLLAVTDKRRQVLKDAQWYVDLEDFHLAALQQINPRLKLPASLIDGKLWLTTRHGRLVEAFALARLSTDKSLLEKIGESPELPASLSGHLRLEFSGDPDGKHWQAMIRIQDLKTRDLEQDEVNLRISRAGDILKLEADALDIAMLHNLLVMFGLPGLPDSGWQFEGVLRDVSISYDLQRRRPAAARLRVENAHAITPYFTAARLAGEVQLEGDELHVLVDSDQGELVIPALIRRPIEWNNLVMTVVPDLQSDNPEIKVPQLWCDCKDLELDSMARLVQGDGIFLNLASQLRQVKVRNLYKYWPAGIWKEKLISWLDNALQGGEIPDGGIAYLGHTRRYPFTDHSGKFVAQASTKEVVLQYEPDWPKLRHVDADVTFLNRSMQARVHHATSMGATIRHGEAKMADMKKGQLTVTVAASGRNNYLIDFLRASELGRKIPLLQEKISLRGPSDVDLRLDLSLKPSPVKKPVRPYGAVHLRGVDFQLNEFALDDLRGDVQMQGFLLNLANIKTRFLDNGMTLAGTISLPDKQTPEIDLHLDGPVAVASIEKRLGHDLPLQGQSLWRFGLKNKANPEPAHGVEKSADQSVSDSVSPKSLTVANSSAKKTPQLHFSGETDLLGVAIDLPQPLRKPAEISAPLRFDCDHPCTQQAIDVRYADTLFARVRWLPEAARLAVEKLLFGPANQDLPFPIGGEIETLDLDGWLALLARRSGEKSLFVLPDGEYRFHLKRGIFMARELHDIDVRVLREDAAWRILLDGPDVVGEVLVADDASQRGIVVQLQKLNWPEVSDTEGQAVNSQETSFDLPALHVWVKDFTYQGIPLGEMRLEMRPVVSGMKIEKFESRNRWITLNATGDWLRPDPKAAPEKGLGESRFHIVMVSDNLGKLLQSIGYDSPVKGGQTVVEMNVNWPGPPARFSFDRLNGELTVRIGPGEVTEAKPGIGRVFGLLNLTNLPRRLILDFADVLSQGLRFEAMNGHFMLAGGQATTDDFEVLYSGAKIRVRGSMDLVRQTYNQTLTVIPKVGQILPTLGAIAGGPAGAAAGFLMQGMLHDSLKKSGKFVYRVTGPWESPVIELIDVEKARPAEVPLDYKQPAPAAPANTGEQSGSGTDQEKLPQKSPQDNAIKEPLASAAGQDDQSRVNPRKRPETSPETTTETSAETGDHGNE